MIYFAAIYCTMCGCKHSVGKIEVLNIEEDYIGRDVVTFICPNNPATQTSLVFANYDEGIE